MNWGVTKLALKTVKSACRIPFSLVFGMAAQSQFTLDVLSLHTILPTWFFFVIIIQLYFRPYLFYCLLIIVVARNVVIWHIVVSIQFLSYIWERFTLWILKMFLHSPSKYKFSVCWVLFPVVIHHFLSHHVYPFALLFCIWECYSSLPSILLIWFFPKISSLLL